MASVYVGVDNFVPDQMDRQTSLLFARYTLFQKTCNSFEVAFLLDMQLFLTISDIIELHCSDVLKVPTSLVQTLFERKKVNPNSAN